MGNARPHDIHRGHADAFPAECRTACGDRNRGGTRGAASWSRAARRAAVARDIRRTRSRPHNAPMRESGGSCSTSARLISNTTERWNPDVALEPSIRALYPFCRLTDRRQCAGDARAAFGAHHVEALRGRLGGGSNDRATPDGYGAARADHADELIGQPDRRSRLPRRVSDGGAVEATGFAGEPEAGCTRREAPELRRCHVPRCRCTRLYIHDVRTGVRTAVTITEAATCTVASCATPR